MAPAVTVVNLPQPRYVADDWYELLEVAAKVSGTMLLLFAYYNET